MLKSPASILGHVTAYRLWMAPFAEKKLAPVRQHNDLSAVSRVLDVGCGPGTNTASFAHANYLGIDLNPAYVEYARRSFGRDFIVADARSFVPPSGAHFDFILVNSFFHHVDLPATRRILSHLATLLTDRGHIHILDLVLPERRGVARTLASWDRGDYPRGLEEWRGIFQESFEPVVSEPYAVGVAGLKLWNMIYFKGKSRR